MDPRLRNVKDHQRSSLESHCAPPGPEGARSRRHSPGAGTTLSPARSLAPGFSSAASRIFAILGYSSYVQRGRAHCPSPARSSEIQGNRLGRSFPGMAREPRDPNRSRR
jgi:hypothetical protein